jgi:hypothetical protein
MHAEILSETPNESQHIEDIGVDGRITLEWILGKQGGKMWAGCTWLTGISSGFL